MRKLASVRNIRELHPIEGADRIEVAVVDGWEVVVKKGVHHVGELVCYLEIDSWVPHKLAPFLTSKGHFPRVYNEVEGERLKTIKLRGQISQGLILSLSDINLPATQDYVVEEGLDLTEVLGIQKWERPEDNSTGTKVKCGKSSGTFPSHLVPKTDEERIQNLTGRWNRIVHSYEGNYWEITEKIDGSSITMLIEDGEVVVCSRNLKLKDDGTSDFWNVINRYGAADKFKRYCEEVGDRAIQGEIHGLRIQGNKYSMEEQDIRWFSLFDIETKKYLDYMQLEDAATFIDMKTVPLLYFGKSLPDETISGMVAYADGKSKLNPQTDREGVVIRKFDSEGNMRHSFKAISNKFLLHGGD